MESIPLGTHKRWSLLAGNLYIQVVFRASVTVCILIIQQQRLQSDFRVSQNGILQPSQELYDDEAQWSAVSTYQSKQMSGEF